MAEPELGVLHPVEPGQDLSDRSPLAGSARAGKNLWQRFEQQERALRQVDETYRDRGRNMGVLAEEAEPGEF